MDYNNKSTDFFQNGIKSICLLDLVLIKVPVLLQRCKLFCVSSLGADVSADDR